MYYLLNFHCDFHYVIGVSTDVTSVSFLRQFQTSTSTSSSTSTSTSSSSTTTTEFIADFPVVQNPSFEVDELIDSGIGTDITDWTIQRGFVGVTVPQAASFLPDAEIDGSQVLFLLASSRAEQVVMQGRLQKGIIYTLSCLVGRDLSTTGTFVGVRVRVTSESRTETYGMITAEDGDVSPGQFVPFSTAFALPVDSMLKSFF